MGTVVVTAPAIEPVTLSEALLHLRMDSTEQNARVQSMISAARFWAEGYTRRAFINRTMRETFDYGWPTEIDFAMSPVSAVSSITYVDTNGVTQTLAASQYTLHNASAADGLPYVAPAYDVTWPDTRYIESCITVQYVAGYGATAATVPECLREAILLHVELLFDRDGTNRDALEAARNALLDPYRIARL